LHVCQTAEWSRYGILTISVYNTTLERYGVAGAGSKGTSDLCHEREQDKAEFDEKSGVYLA